MILALIQTYKHYVNVMSLMTIIIYVNSDFNIQNCNVYLWLSEPANMFIIIIKNLYN